jgi:hypothetical protein
VAIASKTKKAGGPWWGRASQQARHLSAPLAAVYSNPSSSCIAPSRGTLSSPTPPTIANTHQNTQHIVSCAFPTAIAFSSSCPPPPRLFDLRRDSDSFAEKVAHQNCNRPRRRPVHSISRIFEIAAPFCLTRLLHISCLRRRH